MNSNYKRNKERAIYRDTTPTRTDQSQANDTDVNTIIRRHSVNGTAPGASHQPMYEDWTEIPTNLRDMIESTRSIARLRRQLPKELQDYTTEQLMAMQPKQIADILKPPAPTPAPTETPK